MSVPESPKQKKLYYSISEIAENIQESTSLIRFWEKKFPTIQPKKNNQGKRLYTPQDLKTIIHIHNLVKKQGYTLEGAKLSLKQTKTVKQEETIINNLKEIRAFFTDLIKD